MTRGIQISEHQRGVRMGIVVAANPCKDPAGGCFEKDPFLDAQSAHGDRPHLLIQPMGRLRFSTLLRIFNLLPVLLPGRKMRNPQLV
jgi:hypothetical protein